MEERTWKHEPDEESRGWPAGEWDDEPDKVHWIDEETDMDCLIVRNGLGGLCGYVAVTEDHPFYGKDYDDVDVEVHGGLTFASKCQEHVTEDHGVCHVPAPGRSDNVWWLGFDCAHLGDACPGMIQYRNEISDSKLWDRDTYKNIAYVKNEIRLLAKQLKAVK